jgi:hypothetical protein
MSPVQCPLTDWPLRMRPICYPEASVTSTNLRLAKSQNSEDVNSASAEGWNLADLLTVIFVQTGETVRCFQNQICPPCLLNCRPFFLKEAIPGAKFEALIAVLPNIRVLRDTREERIPVSESQQSLYAYLNLLVCSCVTRGREWPWWVHIPPLLTLKTTNFCLHCKFTCSVWCPPTVSLSQPTRYSTTALRSI